MSICQDFRCVPLPSKSVESWVQLCRSLKSWGPWQFELHAFELSLFVTKRFSSSLVASWYTLFRPCKMRFMSRAGPGKVGQVGQTGLPKRPKQTETPSTSKL